jgi:hypothetical protein
VVVEAKELLPAKVEQSQKKYQRVLKKAVK